MMNIRQKKFLRKMAHELEPVVWIGQHGLTDNVLHEINTALEHHELIKVKVRAGDRKERDRLIDRISVDTGALAVQKIGSIAVFYRRNPEQAVIQLP